MNELVLNEARELIAGFIANRRKELGISQAELAERTQLGIATIKRMEDAKFWPNMKQFMIICQSLDLYFFVEEKEGKKDMAKLMRERWTRKGDQQ
jgi:transcriptional regulator with XRE-family HTH domain